MNTIGDASPVVFWQLAFWPPDREIVITARRPAVGKIIARMAVLELTVLTLERQSVAPEFYPCTYPGCSWGPAESAKHLANHRFAAHQIRSTNEQSIKRQERRDKHRAESLGAAPEYIDRARIRAAVGELVPVPSGVALKDGPLDLGEREHVRRRLTHFVGTQLAREIRRSPAEICLTVAEIAASALAPVYPKIVESTRADNQMARLEQLFTKAPALATA